MYMLCWSNVSSGLSFGRVDELGRYETDIEPEPDRKSGMFPCYNNNDCKLLFINNNWSCNACQFPDYNS